MSHDLNPLSLSTTEELVQELERRVTACIVAWECQDKGAAVCRFRYHGGFSAALGLACRFQRRLIWADREDGDDLGEF